MSEVRHCECHHWCRGPQHHDLCPHGEAGALRRENDRLQEALDHERAKVRRLEQVIHGYARMVKRRPDVPASPESDFPAPNDVWEER